MPLVVVADDQSELDETFLVQLGSVAGGALLDTRRTNVTLTVGMLDMLVVEVESGYSLN